MAQFALGLGISLRSTFKSGGWSLIGRSREYQLRSEDADRGTTDYKTVDRQNHNLHQFMLTHSLRALASSEPDVEESMHTCPDRTDVSPPISQLHKEASSDIFGSCKCTPRQCTFLLS